MVVVLWRLLGGGLRKCFCGGEGHDGVGEIE